MKRIGIVSYNMYGNFTNYGSALQTYAMQRAIDSLGSTDFEAVVVNYCPDILADKDILNPMKNMWDSSKEALERCRLSLPAIQINHEKFQHFYKSNYRLTLNSYSSKNFNDSKEDEKLDGYLCGSDTIFAVPEFGFDDGYYANFPVMKGQSVAYAASFGDYDVQPDEIQTLKERLNNFNAIALRECDKLGLVKSLFDKPLYKVIDPTLLLNTSDYNAIVEDCNEEEPYLLLYSRRHNEMMQEYAEEYALEHNLKLIEISLNARNAEHHTMRYDAGVEEFLGLVKNASMVVTNSFHGMIFAVQFRREFAIFSRQLCNTKIDELLELFDLSDRRFISGLESTPKPINYDDVHARIEKARNNSLEILHSEILTLLKHE